MKAHNPKPTPLQDMLELGAYAEELIQKAMKNGKGKSSDLAPSAHDISPWDSSSAYGDGWRDDSHAGTLGLDYSVLQQMARVPVVSAIIQTRVNQVAEFCTPQPDKFSAGFKISLRDKGAELTDENKEQISELTRWMETCGEGNKYSGAYDFEAFVRMILRDSLMYDQACFEILRTRGGDVAGFVPVDASTIRRSSIDAEEKSAGRRDWRTDAYIQVVNQKKVAEWDARALAFAVRRPRTWIYSRGYGYPELEELIRTVTYLVNAETYNASNFTNGIHVNSILAIKSKMSPQLFRAFRRDFYAMLSGAHQAKRTPILQLDPEANEEVSSVNMGASAEEMGYATWMGYLTKIACAIYQIDPAELGFVFGSEGVSASLSQGGPEQRILASKDRGLRPLLRSVQGWINRWIVHPIAPHLTLTFEGLDVGTATDKLNADKERVSHYMTINEVRAENDLEPLEKGGDIILNQTYITGMMGEGMEGADAPLGGDEPEQDQDVMEDPEQDATEDQDEELEPTFEQDQGIVDEDQDVEKSVSTSVDEVSKAKKSEPRGEFDLITDITSQMRELYESRLDKMIADIGKLGNELKKSDAQSSAVTKAKKRTLAQTPAPPEDRITGSKKNSKGSASGSRGGIELNRAQIKALENMRDVHNKHYPAENRKVDLGTLKAVYRRGAGAFSTSHRPNMTRQQWALARVRAFLRLVGKGRRKASYIQDHDLLPKGHPQKKDS